MSQQIYQLRFGFGIDEDNITAEELISPTGLMFQHICQLSIETIPGVKFYLNNNAIVIGVTGIYEVYLPDGDLNLRFDNNITQAPLTILVNLVYEAEEMEHGEETTTDTI